MDSQQNPQAIPPNFLDMNELVNQLFTKINALEQDVRECHNRHLEATQLQNGALVRVIEKNTAALEQIEQLLKRKIKL